MAQETILEEGAFQLTQRTQINNNFTELYASVTGGTGDISASDVAAAGFLSNSVGQALTAAGNNRATSLALTAQTNNVTTAAASTGVTLPTGAPIGSVVTIANNGASTLAVYAAGSETINGTAGSTGVTLASTKYALYWRMTSLVWISVTIN